MTATVHRMRAAAVLGCLAAAACAGTAVAVEWQPKATIFLGPLPHGKTELDGDVASAVFPDRGVLDALDEWRRTSRRRRNDTTPRLAIPSEIAPGGLITQWSAPSTVRVDGAALAVEIAPEVDWNPLYRALGAEVLEYTGWLFAPFLVRQADRLTIRCEGVVACLLLRNSSRGERRPPRLADLTHIAGDIYGTGFIQTAVTLLPGRHALLVHVRAKVKSALRLIVAPANTAAVTVMHVPHMWASDRSDEPALVLGAWMSAVLMNGEAEWLRSINCTATVDADVAMADDAARHATTAHVAPGSSLIVPCRILSDFASPRAGKRRLTPHVRITGLRCPTSTVGEGGGDGAPEATIAVDGEAGVATAAAHCTPWELAPSSTPAVPQLQRRTPSQSALFSFLDHDGSVAQAAMIAPLGDVARGGRSAPIMLSFHGTGVSAQSQADAYKRKVTQSDSDYVFGVDGYFVLTPGRHGAHNWQGVGQRHGMAAVAALGALIDDVRGRRTCPDNDESMASQEKGLGCIPPADSDRLLITGHSMGGHGAWLAAATFPDRVIAAAPAAGWLVKEGYADANTLLKLDATEPDVPPWLRAALVASVADQRADSHAANLVGVPLHVRVGAADATTSPYYSRRMLRLVRAAYSAAGAPVTTAASLAPAVEEVPGKEHWWWDTARSNDGGTVNDITMRRFYEAHRDRLSARAAWRIAHSGTEAVTAATHNHTVSAACAFIVSDATTFADGRHGLHVEALVDRTAAPGRLRVRMSTVNIGWSTIRVWAIAADNVAQLRYAMPGGGLAGLAAAAPPMAQKLKLLAQVSAGERSGWCRLAAAEAPAWDDAVVPPLLLCIDDTALLTADVEGVSLCHGSDGAWEPCTDAQHLPPPAMRAVTAAPFTVAIAADVVDEEAVTAAAIFLSQLHASAHHTFAPIVSGADHCAFPGNVLLLQRDPNLRSHHGGRSAGAFDIGVQGRWVRCSGRGGLHLDLVMRYADADGLWNVLRLATPTIPPMVRAPFANLFAAHAAGDNAIRAAGMGGFTAFGFDAATPLTQPPVLHGGGEIEVEDDA